MCDVCLPQQSYFSLSPLSSLFSFSDLVHFCESSAAEASSYISVMFLKNNEVKWPYEIICELEHVVSCLGSALRAALRKTELGLSQRRILVSIQPTLPSVWTVVFFFFSCGFSELQVFAHHGRPTPRFQVTLCFGEEFPDPQRQRKLITAHVSIQLHHRQVVHCGAGPFREVANEE